jgi:hypothetical protein
MEDVLEILVDNGRTIGSRGSGLSCSHGFSPLQYHHLVMNIFLRV